MKFKITKSILSAIAFGTFWVASWGSAQALPICAPTYSIENNAGTATVILTANCTPYPNSTIDANSGYYWTKNNSSVTGVTGGSGNGTSQYSEPATPGADGQTYGVVATESNGVSTSSNSVALVTVSANAPTYYPTCLLSASTTTITAGAPVTLTPACQGAYANSLDWYSGPGNGTYSQMTSPPGGIVFPSGPTTTYYVVGANDYGDSASNLVTVTTAAPLSACSSISPSSQSVTLGSGSSSLSASCSNSPTSYVWKLGSTTLSCTTSTCIVPAGSLPSATTYNVTVTANNAGGTGTAAASATITVSSQPLSACTSISPSSQSVTLGSGSSSLSATCNNSPTSYVWTLNGNPLSCTGSTCSVPAASLPSATTYNVAVTANNAGGSGTTAASATITVTGSPPPAGCTIIQANWGNSVQIGVTPLQTMNNGQQFAFTWPIGANIVETSQLLYSSLSTHLLTVSTTPCGFTAPVGGIAACSVSGANPAVSWNTTGTVLRGQCPLVAGTTYYFNVRNATTPTGADNCPAGTSCTYYFGK